MQGLHIPLQRSSALRLILQTSRQRLVKASNPASPDRNAEHCTEARISRFFFSDVQRTEMETKPARTQTRRASLVAILLSLAALTISAVSLWYEVGLAPQRRSDRGFDKAPRLRNDELSGETESYPTQNKVRRERTSELTRFH